MARSSQPPSSVRLSTSRPSTSPPSHATLDARANGLVTNWVVEYGATAGPITATSTTSPAITSPVAPRGVRTARPSTAMASDLRAMSTFPSTVGRRSGSGQPPPRAHGERDDVGQDVDGDVEGRQDKHDGLDLRDVPVGDRRHQGLAQSRVVEHVLDHHHPA